jgi:tetratricopeptide (TPR) repeat protein
MGRLTDLRKTLETRYTLESLEVLCADIDVPWESLSGDTLPKRALSLLRYLDKQNRLPDLIVQAQKDFPDAQWTLPPPLIPGEADSDDDLPDGGVNVRVGDVGGSGQVNIGGVAQVKNNTGNVAVGSRNVIQIGSLNVPRWLVIAVPVLIVAGLIIAGLGTARVFTVTQPTPTPVIGPARMSGTFNIAVAQFPETDIDGRQTQTADGDRVSQWVFDSLNAALKETSAAQLWHDSLPLAEKGATIGIITGTTPAERQDAAKDLADRIGAHLVIYGNLKKSGNQAELEPEFYIATAATSLQRESEAEDIVGSNRLGAPVGIQLPLKGDIGLGVGASLESRATFVRGLLFDLIGLHDNALKDFQSIQGKWTTDDERALLNFFLGREALFIFRNDDKAKAAFGTPEAALDEAERSFTASIQGSPDYALGNWGLGTTLLRRAEIALRAETIPTQTAALLDQAIGRYETAIQNTPAAEQPLLVGKMKTSLANAHSLKGQLELVEGRFPEAEALFKTALAEVDEAFALIGATQPRHTAIAHWVRGATLLRQGVMQKFELQDPATGQPTLEKAKAEFEACLNTFDDPQGKRVLDQTLNDFHTNNCKPDLEHAVNAIALTEVTP